MNWMKAIHERHSVRRYTDQPIEGDVLKRLQAQIDTCRKESGLTIELRLNDAETFGSFLASYGMLKGVRNYLVFSGEESDDLDQRVGYYGEKIVLAAQLLGLKTCWVAGSYPKGKMRSMVPEGERLVCVIVIGYGVNSGKPHRSKALEKLYRCDGTAPEWFLSGVRAAQLAPTAVNQQQFRFELHGNTVTALALRGFYTQIDLGIVRFHFEVGAGDAEWVWG